MLAWLVIYWCLGDRGLVGGSRHKEGKTGDHRRGPDSSPLSRKLVSNASFHTRAKEWGASDRVAYAQCGYVQYILVVSHRAVGLQGTG